MDPAVEYKISYASDNKSSIEQHSSVNVYATLSYGEAATVGHIPAGLLFY
jgi:hypothetical protein